MTRVRKMFREDAQGYKAKADAVSQAEIYKQCFTISICTAEDLSNPTIIGAQAANELLNIRGIKASFVLTDFQGKVHISARSIDELNVQVVMEKLGGGGHITSAGAQLEGRTLQEGRTVIRDILTKMKEEGELQ